LPRSNIPAREAAQQAFEIVALDRRAAAFAQAPYQLVEDFLRAQQLAFADLRHALVAVRQGAVAAVRPAAQGIAVLGLLLVEGILARPFAFGLAETFHHLAHRVACGRAHLVERFHLRAERPRGRAALQLALRVAHRAFGAPETFGHLAHHVAELAHEIGKCPSKRVLLGRIAFAVPFALALLTLLALLPLLPLLALLAGAELAGPVLLRAAERAVDQALLAAHHFLQALHHFLRLAVAGLAVLVAFALGLLHAEILEHLLEPRQQIARRVARARARKLARLIEQFLQILALHALGVAVGWLAALVGVAQGLFEHRAQMPVDRRLQFAHHLLDFGVRRVFGERVLQPFHEGAQFALGARLAAVFDAQGRFPHQALHVVEHLAEIGGIGAHQAQRRDAQAQKHRLVVGILRGVEADGGKRAGHAGAQLGIAHQQFALFDHRARHRMLEEPFGQHPVERFGLARLAGFVRRAQRHAHVEPGPRMAREIVQADGRAVLGAQGRERQRKVDGRARARFGVGRAADLGDHAREAVIVARAVLHANGRARIALRRRREFRRRRGIGDQTQRPRGKRAVALLDCETLALLQVGGHAPRLQARGPGGGRRGGERGIFHGREGLHGRIHDQPRLALAAGDLGDDLAADRNGDFVRLEARQHRRQARIGRRRDPQIEGAGQHRKRLDPRRQCTRKIAPGPVAADGDRHDQDQPQQDAQCQRIAHCHARMRPPGAQARQHARDPHAVGGPQSLRHCVVRSQRQTVLKGGERAVRKAAGGFHAPPCGNGVRQAERFARMPQSCPQGGPEQQQRRPMAKPMQTRQQIEQGNRCEERNDRESGPECRPQSFPGQRKPRAPKQSGNPGETRTDRRHLLRLRHFYPIEGRTRRRKNESSDKDLQQSCAGKKQGVYRHGSAGSGKTGRPSPASRQCKHPQI
jgi:hypothetical protein